MGWGPNPKILASHSIQLEITPQASVFIFSMNTAGLRNAEVQIIFTYEDESEETFIWEWDENGDVSGSGLEIDDVNAGEDFYGVQTFSFSWTAEDDTTEGMLRFPFGGQYDLISGYFNSGNNPNWYYIEKDDQVILHPISSPFACRVSIFENQGGF